jgi:CRISPR system Cascade subunit CasE
MAELYLSRLWIDARRPGGRTAIADLGEIHRLVMRAFPADSGAEPRATHGVLWRLDEGRLGAGPSLLVQSTTRPDWSRLPDIYPVGEPPEFREVSTLLARIEPGRRLRFRLVANPTRKVDTKSGPDGARRHGRRVPLHDDADVLEWLIRKGAEAGFSVGAGPVEAASSVVVQRLGDSHGTRRGGDQPRARLTLRSVAFEGVLTVLDVDRLRAAITAGLGSGKAYGHGLLTVGPP